MKYSDGVKLIPYLCYAIKVTFLLLFTLKYALFSILLYRLPSLFSVAYQCTFKMDGNFHSRGEAIDHRSDVSFVQAVKVSFSFFTETLFVCARV